MKICIDRIPEKGLHIVETRPPEWWTNITVPAYNEGDGWEGPVQLDITFNRVGSQIHAQGKILAKIRTFCARCLEGMSCEVEAPVDVFLVPERPGMTDREEDVGYETYHGEHIDMGEYIRGQLSLHFPSRFYCRPDCRGLCPQCGINLNNEKCSCAENKIDPRWAALKNLKL